jgi:hypothetical protein
LQLEHQELAAQHELLLAENMELHLHCEDLDKALLDMQSGVESDVMHNSPAAIIQDLLDTLENGRLPSSSTILALRNALATTTQDMFEPSNEALMQHIHSMHMDVSCMLGAIGPLR